MKKVLILIYAILLCFLLLSCDSKEIINQEPDYGVRYDIRSRYRVTDNIFKI